MKSLIIIILRAEWFEWHTCTYKLSLYFLLPPVYLVRWMADLIVHNALWTLCTKPCVLFFIGNVSDYQG